MRVPICAPTTSIWRRSPKPYEPERRSSSRPTRRSWLLPPGLPCAAPRCARDRRRDRGGRRPDEIRRRSARRRRSPESTGRTAPWCRGRSTRTTTASSPLLRASATTCRSSCGATGRSTGTRRGYPPTHGHRALSRSARCCPRGDLRLRLLLRETARATRTRRRRSRPARRLACASCSRAASTTGTAPAAYRESIPEAVRHFEELAARYQDRARF